MELLLNALVLILCKKVPVECDVKKIEKLTERVKLVKAPVDAFTKAKAFSAVVRLTTPVIGEDLVDQQDRAVAVNSRNSTLPYTVIVLNQSASSCAREDFVLAMAKPLPNLF